MPCFHGKPHATGRYFLMGFLPVPAFDMIPDIGKKCSGNVQLVATFDRYTAILYDLQWVFPPEKEKYLAIGILMTGRKRALLHLVKFPHNPRSFLPDYLLDVLSGDPQRCPDDQGGSGSYFERDGPAT
jgi:hypothetical protein